MVGLQTTFSDDTDIREGPVGQLTLRDIQTYFSIYFTFIGRPHYLAEHTAPRAAPSIVDDYPLRWRLLYPDWNTRVLHTSADLAVIYLVRL